MSTTDPEAPERGHRRAREAEPSPESEDTPNPFAEQVKERFSRVKTAGLAAGGAWVVAVNADAAAPAPGWLILSTIVAGPVTWYGSRRILERKLDGEEPERIEKLRRFTTATTTAGFGWLTSTNAFGLDLSTIGGTFNVTLGAALTMWAATPYLAFRRRGMRPVENDLPEEYHVEEPAEPEPVLGWELERRKYLTLWSERVAIPKGILPDTHLDDGTIVEIKGGWTAKILSDVPGTINPQRFTGATAQLAGAFRVGLPDVTVEVDADDASQANLTILHDNPLVRFQVWQGPYALLGENGIKSFDPETGLAVVGVYSDGELVFYRFWNSGGAWHDLICGATGSGKSEFVNLLLAYERHATVEVPVLDGEGNPTFHEDGTPVTVTKGLIASWVGDPQRGQSFTDWQDAVDWFAPSLDEIRTMLQKAEREMYARNGQLANAVWYQQRGKKKIKRRGIKDFRATPEMQLICITIDEAHEVLKDPECKRIVAALGKMGRKVGIKLRLITQVPLLQELGGDMAIRDAVASGNVIIFRTANALSGQVAFNSSLPAQPNTIPREWARGRAAPGEESTAGLGYVLGAVSRPAMMRALYGGEAIDWIYDEEGDEWGETTSPHLSSGTDDPAYRDRKERVERLAALPGGPPPPGETGGRTSGLSCNQLVLKVLVEHTEPGTPIKMKQILERVGDEFSTKSVSNSLTDFAGRRWVQTSKDGELKHGWYLLTDLGREQGPMELGLHSEVPDEVPDETAGVA